MERVTRRKLLIKAGLTVLGGAATYFGFVDLSARSNKYRDQVRAENSGLRPFQESELITQRIKESGEEGLQVLDGILILGGTATVITILDLIPKSPPGPIISR